jgi:nucleotide-binding universal stress UspA family protein
MTYKTILLHLDPHARSAEHVGLAFRLAGIFGAHLVGLYAPGPVRIPSYALAEAGPALRQAVEQHRAESARNAEKLFREAMAKQGDARVEWRAAEGETASALRLNARYADLVISPQAEPADEPESRLLPHEIVLAAGRPVLFVPYAGRFADTGRRVLIAWDGGGGHRAVPLAPWRQGYGPPAKRRGLRRRGADPVARRGRSRRPHRDGRLRPCARARAGAGGGHPHHPRIHDGARADVALKTRTAGRIGSP